jgi:hypothetical protein
LLIARAHYPPSRLRYDVSLFLKVPHLRHRRPDGVICAVYEHDHIRVVTFLHGKLILSDVQNKSARLDDISPVAVFLASDAAALVTGAEYEVTAGDSPKDI